ncbi:hypothetical protein MUY14_29965 [Amycolatopsis sp. FBCC-B4732]|uniref:amino acid--tRNA ligase-related protein n=1 Tax=Amycolatopsis sp. FBCC-B4732 TaxID=3079339 RepID=UPI001FF6E466|nr:amino acid--tRNA ligase-related protein [Amycolatopsis sp. FBCC-B4732]UOX85984.1 hypothetical protein MUY14_29965 [Amycolatopsis sp. FBCC-B4732]
MRGFRSTVDSEVHTPEIVASATESGANVFGIGYFGRPAYLAQYTSLDAELGFIRDHHDVRAVLRDVLAGMAGDLVPVPAEIPEIHFAEALDFLGVPADEPDLSPAHERALSEWALREHGSEFLFVTGYPMANRPFSTHPDPARPGYSNSFALLFRGGFAIGLERWTARLFGAANVREVTLFPRDLHRLTP